MFLLAETDWVAAVSAFIGPLFGVYIAYILTKQESKRQASTILFKDILEKSQEVTWASVSMAEARKRYQFAYAKLAGASAIEEKSILMQAATMENQHGYQKQDELQLARRLLLSNQASLRLLFDSEGDKCAQDIENLVQWSFLANDGEFVQEEIDDGLKLLEIIINDVRRLTRSLNEIDSQMDPSLPFPLPLQDESESLNKS